MIRSIAVSAAAILAASASPALADPCKGALPRPGVTFTGKVRYIGDGDSLCVGPTAQPNSWIEVRLADFDAPELHEPGGARAKRLLAAVAMGRTLACRSNHRSYDRIVARCTINDRRVGDILRERGGVEGGR